MYIIMYIYNIYILYNDSIISTWKPRNHNSLRSASLGLAAQWWRGCHPSTRYLWDRCPKQDRCSSGTQKLGPGPQRDRNFIEIYMRYLLRVLFIGILREYHGIWNIMKRIYIYISIHMDEWQWFTKLKCWATWDSYPNNAHHSSDVVARSSWFIEIYNWL